MIYFVFNVYDRDSGALLQKISYDTASDEDIQKAKLALIMESFSLCRANLDRPEKFLVISFERKDG